MGIIKDKLSHIIKFNLNRATMQVVQQHKTEIEDLNKDQLNNGLKANGKEMPAYAPFTVKFKKREGKPIPASSTYNLFDEGTLHRGIYVEPKPTFMNITSTDPNLKKKLGDNGLTDADAFGLTEKSKEIFAERILVRGLQLKLRAQ